ncbi:MAG: hypothetical protein QM796_02345 [Chthoniobacteraceae bacterium]
MSWTQAAFAAEPALSIYLKDGRVIAVPAFERQGDTLMVNVVVAGAAGKVGYPIANVAKLESPEPPALQEAVQLQVSGKLIDALAKVNGVAKAEEPVRDLPGSWWPKAVAIRLPLLIALHLDREAAALTSQMLACKASSAPVQLAQAEQASDWIRRGQPQKTLDMVEPIIAASKSPDVLAPVWLVKADALLALRQYPQAILAYLRVPVLYPHQQQFIPTAMLGAGRSQFFADDAQDGTNTLKDLLRKFPDAPEAAPAKDELKKRKAL